MARALKVFTWSDGFHRYTVAETSRAKALAAWETDRDLFKEGVAKEAPDAPDAKAALEAGETEQRDAEAELERRRRELDAEAAALSARWVTRRTALAKTIARLRR